MSGMRTVNLDEVALIDEVVGNRSGTTVKQSFTALANQLAASGIVAPGSQDLADLQTDFTSFSPVFGLTPAMTLGGKNISISRSLAATETGVKPSIGVSISIDGTGITFGEGNRMFGGMAGYGQGRITGGNPDGSSDTFMSVFAAYAINNMVGDGDVIGFHGRARKTNIAGNVGDACGVMGDIYQFGAGMGAAMALEGRVYRSIGGRVAADGYAGGNWETAAHLMSDSVLSPALAAMIIGGTGTSALKYSFWNGINLTREAFFHNGAGAGIAGTVGINMGDWDAAGHAQFALKFGYADGSNSYQFYRGDAGLHAAANLFQIINPLAAGGAGLRIKSKGANNAYIDLMQGSTFKAHFFWDNTVDIVAIGTSFNGDLVLRRDSGIKARLKSYGVMIEPQTDKAVGIRNESALGYNAFYDLANNGAVKGQFFYDNVSDVVAIGSTPSIDFVLRRGGNEKLRLNAGGIIVTGTASVSITAAGEGVSFGRGDGVAADTFLRNSGPQALRLYPSGDFSLRQDDNTIKLFFNDTTGFISVNHPTAADYNFFVNGSFAIRPGAAVEPVTNGDLVIQKVSNTNVTIKLKGTDGTVRAVSLTLA